MYKKKGFQYRLMRWISILLTSAAGSDGERSVPAASTSNALTLGCSSWSQRLLARGFCVGIGFPTD